MDRLRGGNVLLVRVVVSRGLHSTKARAACRGTKDRSGSSGASLDDAWCKPGGIKCKKMWYDKEVEMSNTGKWVSCHSRPAGLAGLCGEICPPRRVLLRRTRGDLCICSWDCDTMELPPCWVFKRTWVHKIKCIISKIPIFLFLVFLVAITYKSEVWTIPDPNLKFIVEVRQAFNKCHNEIFDAGGFRRSVTKWWNKMWAYAFHPFAWIVGSSSWTRQVELQLNLSEMCQQEDEEDEECEAVCAEELCEHEVHYDPAEEELKWPQYRDLEQFRWQQEMNELKYDKIPAPATAPHAYQFMPDINVKEKCKIYKKEAYAKAENWMPPPGAVPVIENRHCFIKSVEGIRMKIQRRRQKKLGNKCPHYECRETVVRDRCLYDKAGCLCPAFLRPRQPEYKFPKCMRDEEKKQK